MKKTFKRIICFTLCIIMCLGALTSCATVPFRKAKKDDEKLVKKFEDANYEVESISGTMVKYVEETLKEEYGVQGVKAIVMAVPEEAESDDEVGIFFYCEKSSDARKSKAALNDYAKENQDDVDVELIVKRSGKMVYVGTRSVWRTAKAICVSDVILAIVTVFAVIISGAVAICAIIVLLFIVAKMLKNKKNSAITTATENVVEAPAEETVTEEAVAEEAPAEEAVAEQPAE